MRTYYIFCDTYFTYTLHKANSLKMRHKNKFLSSEKSKVNLYQMLKTEIRQFCLNTALHGYKYIGEKHRSVLTRFTWTFITSAAFISGFVLVWLSWQYNTHNQFITLADSVHNPIWNYRFPAVTICNLNKVSLKKAKAFAENLNKPDGVDTDHVLMLMSYLVQLLYAQYDLTNMKYYYELRELFHINNLTAHEVMLRIRPDCKELLRSCFLKGRIRRCDSLFEEVTSVEGLCCTTNYYGLKNRMFSGYYSERYKKKPRRMSACGFRTGYKVLLNNKPEDYLVSGISGYGTKVLIHDAFNYAGWSTSNELIPIESQAFISVIPTLLYTTDAIKYTKISQRNCLFTWEKSLKYFANYSYDNCLNECRLDIIKNMCGCIPLYYWNIEGTYQSLQMPLAWETQTNIANFISGYDKIPPCDLKDAACITTHKELLVSSLPGYVYPGKEDFDYESAKEQSLCDCIPDCEIYEYSIDTARSKFSRKSSVNEFEFYGNVQSENHSVINVFYKDLIAFRNIRDVSLSWYAELAWFGGLLGLCVGFSCTSGFEILYYLTIRLGLDYFLKRKQNKTVKPSGKQQITKEDLEIFTVYRNHFTVPPMQKLYNLRRTNNEWYID